MSIWLKFVSFDLTDKREISVRAKSDIKVFVHVLEVTRREQRASQLILAESDTYSCRER